MLQQWVRQFIIWLVGILTGFVGSIAEEVSEKPNGTSGIIRVNGVPYDLYGTDLTLHRGVLSSGGIVIVAGLSGRVKLVIEGPVCDLTTDGDVECGEVQGSVTADGSVRCGAVNDYVEAGGSVVCGAVGGYVDAGGSVHCADVADYVDAGGSVDCRVIHGNVDAGGSVGIKNQ